MNDDDLDRIATEAGELSAKMWPLMREHLGGRSPVVQGAVFADLVATYLAGNCVLGDPYHTAILRQELLELHIEEVLRLIPINAEILGTPR